MKSLMKRRKCLVVFMILLWMAATGSALFSEDGNEKMAFWSVQRKGANGGLHKFRPEWFKAAATVGLEYIRFHPDFLPAAERDFLMGNGDNFTGLNRTDLALLKRILDEAQANRVKIVLVMLSLPGCRNRQLNNYRDDFRIWKDLKYQEMAFAFWKQLALAIKDHPAVVAYNPLNEPHPEKELGYEEPDDAFKEWLTESKNTPADLNRFNRLMVKAIREVDRETPIILDGYFYADPKGMSFTEPVDDPHILYAFHNIAPWQLAAFRANKGRYSYPDRVPEYWNGPGVSWTFQRLALQVKPVEDFAAAYHIPSQRIIASEFWYDRRVSGCREYLADAIKLYNSFGWHWAFYSFRDDESWGGLDYELGDKPLGAKYWEAVEKGEDCELLKNRHHNPIWEVIRREFR